MVQAAQSSKQLMGDAQVAFVGGPLAIAQAISIFALPHIQGWCERILMRRPHHPFTTSSDHACGTTCKQIKGRPRLQLVCMPHMIMCAALCHDTTVHPPSCAGTIG